MCIESSGLCAFLVCNRGDDWLWRGLGSAKMLPSSALFLPQSRTAGEEMVISSCQIWTWKVGGFSRYLHFLYIQCKVLGKTEPVPPRTDMQIILPAASSNWLPLVAGEEKKTCLKETFRWCITEDVSCTCAFLFVYLACLVMFGCKNSPDKQLTKRNVYLKRWTSHTCVDTYHWSVELQNSPGQM